MIKRKVISLVLFSIWNLNTVCIATGSSLVDDINKEIQKAGCPTLAVDAIPENQPLLSKYSTNVQAFINANQEIVTESSWINKVPSLVGNTPKDKLHHDLYRAYNSLMTVFENLNLKSPKNYYEDLNKSFDKKTQSLNNIQSTSDTLKSDLAVANSNLLLKDQKIESSDNFMKALIEMINPIMFNNADSLTQEQKNLESAKSIEQMVTSIRQNYASYVPI